MEMCGLGGAGDGRCSVLGPPACASAHIVVHAAMHVAAISLRIGARNINADYLRLFLADAAWRRWAAPPSTACPRARAFAVPYRRIACSLPAGRGVPANPWPGQLEYGPCRPDSCPGGSTTPLLPCGKWPIQWW